VNSLQEYRRQEHKEPEELLQGIDGLVHGVIGKWHRRPSVRWRLQRDADQVILQENKWADMAHPALLESLKYFRNCFRRGGSVPHDQQISALAAIRELADRRLGLRAFPVQVMGALALYRGNLVEMATGEGKTLVAGLAAILGGWSGKPCHVITVNDYLVKRDSQWLRPLYRSCGLSVGHVVGEMPHQERRNGYEADITYGTSKEILGDFLRDKIQSHQLQNNTQRLIRQMVRQGVSGGGVVMRGLHTAIVDEADSLLIDEAVTPLIISAPKGNAVLNEVVEITNEVVSDLQEGEDYRVNERYREIEITSRGRSKLQTKSLCFPGIWQGEQRREEVVRQALSARKFYLKGKQYIVEGGRIVIVDEFTGRAMPERSWQQGLHQAIEAKEGLALSDTNETVARMSFQKFFRFYHRLSGMTGTAKETAAELWRIYDMPVVRLPVNKPCIRKTKKEQFFASQGEKWKAVVQTIKCIHATGQPVLAGTRTVRASEKLSKLLSEQGLHCQLLNAVNDTLEADIVKDAGQLGKITVSTNMAGRGTDIRLGDDVKNKGGLFVIATEWHESGRVDRQLLGRAARQGDPGLAQLFGSTEDELLRKYLPTFIISGLSRLLQKELPGASFLSRICAKLAQSISQKQAFKARKTLLKTDRWMEESLSFTGGDGA
jgi:preprotein translocase subunit SecA